MADSMCWCARPSGYLGEPASQCNPLSSGHCSSRRALIANTLASDELDSSLYF